MASSPSEIRAKRRAEWLREAEQTLSDPNLPPHLVARAERLLQNAQALNRLSPGSSSSPLAPKDAPPQQG